MLARCLDAEVSAHYSPLISGYYSGLCHICERKMHNNNNNKDYRLSHLQSTFEVLGLTVKLLIQRKIILFLV